MKLISLVAFLLGILFVVLSYFSALHNWIWAEFFVIIGFVGYVMLISTVSFVLLLLMDKRLEDLSR